MANWKSDDEGHLDGLQTISVSHSLYLGVLHSLGLLLGLVHLLTDDGTCASTYSTTDDSTDSRVTGNGSNNGSQTSTATGTDQRALTRVTHSTTHHQCCTQGDGN